MIYGLRLTNQRSKNDFDEDQLSPVDDEILNIEGGEYFLPSADKDIERLQMQHFLFRYIWDGNFSSPIHDKFIDGGVKVLDIQCGSGIFITDLATQYPTSTFIGIDDDEARSRIQIELPNAEFLHHSDMLEGLPFPDDTFDFVNQRLFTAVSINKWEKFILPEIVRVLKPDAYLEFMELPVWSNMGPVTKQIMKSYDEYLETRGVYHTEPLLLEQILNLTGLVKNIHSYAKTTHLWKGMIGQLVFRNQLQKIDSNKSGLCEYLQISEKQFDSMLETMSDEVVNYKSSLTTYSSETTADFRWPISMLILSNLMIKTPLDFCLYDVTHLR
ncbi:5607_t:CDS:2 [Scutellospora calospora]|uniref:5607_t:CDS:1 n=1 Tax=Scutellospora calospora TaxID=85575 RepID=A0ACA9KVF8_9GLOM|nr:5607_t:CDS:2 [Scutellospora calospora]